MIEISDYQVIELVSNNGEIVLYRLQRSSDGQHVLAMTTCDEYPGSVTIETFRHAYSVLNRLNGRGALKANSMEMAAQRPILMLEDIGGTTLRQVEHSCKDRLEMRTRLEIAVAIADCLVHIHRENMTLNEITPDHLLVNLHTSEVRFVDLRMCSRDGEEHFSLPPDRVDRILVYTSPEYTGRTGRSPDYRSDFYSLGVILYEWLSGYLPFEQQDVLDMMYRHLASTPQMLHRRDSSIPEAVSDIVSRCMDKMPESRYASAYGLKADLEECWNQYRKQGVIHPFVLASRDMTERWSLPALFYGRDTEQQMLREALRRAAGSTAEVVWVNGDGGIGKTSFVKETLLKILPDADYFATSKFDAQHSKLPYDAWIQMMEQLVSRLLTESRIQIEVWKLRMLNALDGYGQLLIELVPKLKLLIGPQPKVQIVSTQESQHRLHQLMNRVFQLFQLRGHPLVLFIDDVQWADEASLQYAASLLEDPNTKHLLLVLACRERDLEPKHPLHLLEQQLTARHTDQLHIHLQAWDHADIIQLLRDAMLDDTTELDALAAVLRSKTEGNPLFLKQLLQDLVNNKHVQFHATSRTWQWNLQHIEAMNVPSNNLAYLSNKLKQFPYGTVYTLGRAAILGRSFDLDLLSSITGLRSQELSEALHPAVQERFIQRAPMDGIQYRFVHDRIQQAAYALVPEEERIDTHMRIGYLLVHRMNNSGAVHIFEVVNHLNEAAGRVERTDQKLELVVLNLQAGLKAKQATAYQTALGYLSQAVALLGDDCWDRSYTIAFRAYREYAEVEYLCSHFHKANDLFDLLINKAKTNLDKTYVYAVKIQMEASHDNYKAVIALGHSTLELLQIRHNYEPSSWELTRQWLRIKRKLRKYPMSHYASLPPATDEVHKVAMSVLAHTCNACFFSNPKGWLSTTFTMIELTLDQGMTPEASIGFIGYALFLYYHFKQDEESYKWGELACRLAEPYPALYVKMLSAYALCMNSWRQFQPSLLETFTKHAGKVGMESGDAWLANHSVLINGGLQLIMGYPLRMIYEQLLAHAGGFARHKHNLHWKQAVVFTELLSRLTGYRASNDPFIEAELYNESFADDVHGDEFHLIEELLCSLAYVLNYLLGNYEEANEALMKSASIMDKRTRYQDYSTQHTYESLVWAQLYDEASEDEQKQYREKMSHRLKLLKKLAKRCPQNHLHRYLLIQAEYTRLIGKSCQAETWYEQAIEAARTYGYVHDLAIAAECYGRHGLRQGKLQLAKIYLTEAYESYMQWGAEVKATEMERKYGHLLQIRGETVLELVDSRSVVMAVQALSGGMEKNLLLDKLMPIMLYHAGADYGALLIAL